MSQATPQAPQLAALVLRSTQAESMAPIGPTMSGHAVRPPVPQPATHAPLWHVVPSLQTLPQRPQLASSACVFVHVVPHWVSPVLQAHFALVQRAPTAHCAPHPPQFSGSSSTSMQAAPHVVSESPASSVVHDREHTPALQTSPTPHAMPHPPQLAGSLATDVHAPPQEMLPFAHTHAPPWHSKPFPHCVLHAPQLALSLWTSMHEEPQES